MEKICITAFDLAIRFLGTKEIAGPKHNPAILAMLQLDSSWATEDEVPWCSAFPNYIAWLLDLPRSKSLRARSWLKVGKPVSLENAERGFDIVVLARGKWKPGPEVIEAPGHVTFFNTLDHLAGIVSGIGGNQRDEVRISAYRLEDVLGVRRLYG